MNKLLTISACALIFSFPGALRGWGGTASVQTDTGVRLAWALAEHGVLDDVIVYTCYASRPLGPHFYAELALESSVFEYEDPVAALPLPIQADQDTPDASGKSTLLRASFGYSFRQEDVLVRPYMRAGIGLGYTDIEGTSCSSDRGPDYQIEVDADDSLEIAPALSAGIICKPRQSRWRLELGTAVEHRLVDWVTTEPDSGTTARLTRIRTWAVFLGVSATI